MHLQAGEGAGMSGGSVVAKSTNGGLGGCSGRLAFSSGSSVSGNSGRCALGSGASTEGGGGRMSVSVGSGTSAFSQWGWWGV